MGASRGSAAMLGMDGAELPGSVRGSEADPLLACARVGRTSRSVVRYADRPQKSGEPIEQVDTRKVLGTAEPLEHIAQLGERRNEDDAVIDAHRHAGFRLHRPP